MNIEIEVNILRLLRLQAYDFAKLLRKYRHCQLSLEEVVHQLHKIKYTTTLLGEARGMAHTCDKLYYLKCLVMLKRFG